VTVTTTNELAGYQVVRHLGLVPGITVRFRNVFGTIGAFLQSLFGGKTFIYRTRRTGAGGGLRAGGRARPEMGANAVLAMRYDANDVANGISEVPAYGTAAVVEPAR
jgi:uncharacterized protein YbjQ (UPF0145 family)